jgi:hypothetical protein
MGFFDDFPPPPPPPEPSRVEHKPWMGPPPGWVGGWVPWHILLTHTSDVYSVITAVEAFPSGVQFTLASRFRPGAIDLHPRPGHPMMGLGSPGGPLFGVGFADGRKVMAGRQFSPLDAQPDGPLLMPRGGGGGGEEWRMGMWLWPLPPPGPLTFVTAWPTLDIIETTLTVEATELIAAAERALRLWAVDQGSMLPAGSFGGGSFATAVKDEPKPSPPAAT